MKDSKIWQTLQNQWKILQHLQISMLQPNISSTNIAIDDVDCGVGGTCPKDFICTNDGCFPLDVINIVASFANTGDTDTLITPILAINGTGTAIIPSEGATITVSAGGTATATFTGVSLANGKNSVCVSW